jgi:hypothetical protein
MQQQQQQQIIPQQTLPSPDGPSWADGIKDSVASLFASPVTTSAPAVRQAGLNWKVALPVAVVLGLVFWSRNR